MVTRSRYCKAGLLSTSFDQQAKDVFVLRLRDMHDYFDISVLRRCVGPLCLLRAGPNHRTRLLSAGHLQLNLQPNSLR
jgi:hypothetical protein